jgi:L-seryl-tRNA(Ser) seleniumtransferase
MTLAALEATLELYRDGRSSEIPTLAMLAAEGPVLRARAERLLAAARAAAPSLTLELRQVRSAVGGGALPLHEPESYALAVVPGGAAIRSAEVLESRLRAARPPILGRIAEGVLLLDVRTVDDDEIPVLVRGLAEAALEPVTGDPAT